MDDEQPARTVARADTPRGEIALRERGEEPFAVHELVVAGVFAMDSLDTSTETLLAERALGAHEDPEHHPPARVLVGGLGLGFTAWTVLKDHRVRRVDVVELEPDLLDWARLGLTPTLAMVARHPRVALHEGDVADVLAGPPGGAADGSPVEDATGPTGPWDLVLLDVDNGPSFLVHEDNRRLYSTDALAAALAHLAPGGVLALWAAQPEPDLLARLRELAPTEEVLDEVTREGRVLTYATYLARPAPTAAS